MSSWRVNAVLGTIRAGRVPALGVLVAIACALVWVPGTGATVPPKNCGMMSVKGKRYQIKADQMRCTTAKTYSRRYLSRHSRPSGYGCTDFGSARSSSSAAPRAYGSSSPSR